MCKSKIKSLPKKSVAVALEGIKKDRVVSMGVSDNRAHVRTSPVTISIAEPLKIVNAVPDSKSLF